jgi:hypothetical protein
VDQKGRQPREEVLETAVEDRGLAISLDLGCTMIECRRVNPDMTEVEL